MAGPCLSRVSVVVWIVAALHVAAAGDLAAQAARPLTVPPDFSIDQWTTEDGLPQNSVNAIVQSRDGHLWVGTFGGLARFDGTGFTVMERRDGSGRHVDRVLSLAEAPDGTLWIGTENGLLRWRDGAYRVYDMEGGLADNEVTALHVGGDGVVWIGTARGGLSRLTDGGLRTYREVDGVPLEHVVRITEDRDGVLWVNVGGRGYITVEGDTLVADRWHDPPVAGARHMPLQDRAGGYWFSRSDGLTRVGDESTWRYTGAQGVILAEDPEGGIWLGTDLDGLHFIRPGGDPVARQYALPRGKRDYRVRSIHVDREDNVWIGTDADGLLRARRNLFTTYTAAHGLSHDVITAVYEDAAGTLWAGTNCMGVNAIDRRSGTVRVHKPRMRGDPEGDPCVFSLAGSPDGTVWAGTFGGGLSRITDDGAQRLEDAGGLPDSVVLALLTDRDGVLWVGTRGGGLSAVEDGRLRETFTTADGLAHDGVRTIRQTRDGALWVGTLGGLSRFHDRRFTSYRAADGLSAGHVRAIHEDPEGTLWIGTYGGGLNRFRDGDFVPITREDGLADDVVSAILEDGQGRLWMSGNLGIFRVARAELNAFADGEIDRVRSVLYGVGDGLVNAETNGGFQPAGWKDVRGHMWFPTVAGLAVVDPARARVDEGPPPVVIEEVVVDGVARRPEEVAEVGPGEANLEFRYTGLSLSTPEHLTYRYQLEGFDARPVDADGRRVAYYPRLPPGQYRFVVSAASRDGVWSEAAATLPLRVAAPFWTGRWFRLALLALLGAIGIMLIRLREAKVRRDREAQEAFSRRLIESQEYERKRIAGALHDELGQQLLVIRNRALLGLRARDLDPDARAQLDHISGVAAESLATVRGLAHTLTPHQLEHLGLAAALEAMVDAVAETTEITIDRTIEDVDGLLTAEGEINLYRVVQESLNNVARHSGATRAAVAVRRVGGGIRVTITDEGRGFHVQRDIGGRLAGGFGMSGIGERVRILDGRVQVDSEPGRGTRIRISLPMAAGGGEST